MMEDSALESLLQKAEDLKAKVHGSENILTDKDAQQYEKELRITYKSIILRDLDFALKRNVEEHLWRSGFKVSIDLGRKINPDGFLVWSSYGRRKADSQKLLEDCLRTGAKFYENLLLEICATFDFNLPYLSDLFKVYEVCNVSNWEESGYKKPKKWSLILMCQNCLTHIGDCIRYEVEYDRASVFFQKALELNQLSGLAHNQFGLLHSYQANLLPCLYHYVRAIATPYPYFKARGNMSVNLAEKAEGYRYMGYMGLSGELSIPKSHIPTFTKYGHVFLVLMGCLCMASERQSILSALVRHLLHSLEEFVAKDIRGSVSICCDSLMRMFAMSVFVLQDAGNGFLPLEGQHIFKSDPKMTRAVVLDLVAGTLETLLKPLPKLNVEKLLFFRGLPTIKLTLDWIRTEPGVLKEKAFQSRPGIWSSLRKVLNKFGDVHNYFNDKEEQFRTVPLPEDRELEGFTVLLPVLSELRFINSVVEKEPEIYNDPAIKFGFLRAHRLLKFGKWMTKQTGMDLNVCFDDSTKNDPVTSSVPDAALEQMCSSDDSDCSDSHVVSLFERLTMMSLGHLGSPQPWKSRCSTSSRPTAGTSTQRGCETTLFSQGSHQDQAVSGSNPPANGHRSRRKRSGRKRRRHR